MFRARSAACEAAENQQNLVKKRRDSQRRGRPAPRRWGSPRTSAASCPAATPGPRRTRRRCRPRRSPWQPGPPGCRRSALTDRPRWPDSSPDWQRTSQRPDETQEEVKDGAWWGFIRSEDSILFTVSIQILPKSLIALTNTLSVSLMKVDLKTAENMKCWLNILLIMLRLWILCLIKRQFSLVCKGNTKTCYQVNLESLIHLTAGCDLWTHTCTQHSCSDHSITLYWTLMIFFMDVEGAAGERFLLQPRFTHLYI